MNQPTIAERLRHHARTLRTNSLPLDALIPLLNQAADELDNTSESHIMLGDIGAILRNQTQFIGSYVEIVKKLVAAQQADVHSCHDECDRPGCVEARAQQAAALDELIASGEEIDNTPAQQAEPVPDFEHFWEGVVADNGGTSIGADYKHWALLGFQAGRAAPSLTVGDERGLALWQLIYGAIAHEPLPLKVGQIERAAKRVEDMLKRRAAAQAEPVAVKALGAEIAHEHDEALAELAAKAEAQFQADIRDAARYRVLRDKQYSFGPRITDPANVWLTYTPEGLDQACDEMLTFEAGSNPPAQDTAEQPNN